MQFVEAEHRQRHQHEQSGETPQHPRCLERGLQIFPGQTRDHPGDGEDHCVRQNIDAGKYQSALGGNVLTGAGDDAGQDRNHREYTRREREAQSSQKEHAEYQPKRAIQRTLEAAVVAGRRRHGLRRGCCAGVCPRKRDIERARHHRITHAVFQTALEIGGQRQRLRRGVVARERNRYLDLIEVHRGRTEIRIGV